MLKDSHAFSGFSVGDLQKAKGGPLQGQASTIRLAFRHARLFFRDDLAWSIDQLFVNFLPMTDGENPDKPRFAIRFVNNAEASDFEFPESG